MGYLRRCGGRPLETSIVETEDIRVSPCILFGLFPGMVSTVLTGYEIGQTMFCPKTSCWIQSYSGTNVCFMCFSYLLLLHLSIYRFCEHSINELKVDIKVRNGIGVEDGSEEKKRDRVC